MRPWLAVLLLVVPAVRAETTSVRWDELRPRVAAALDGEEPEGALGAAVAAGVDDALPRVLLEADDVARTSPDGSLAGLLDRPRAGRLIRNAVAVALRGEGITCTDCRVAAPAGRSLAYADVLPYVVAATYVGEDDLREPVEKPAFHACAGGILAARLPDAELGAVALAAILRSLEDDATRARVRAHVRAAREARPKGDARAVTDLFRGFVATDPAITAALREAVAREAVAAGHACRDCRADDPAGTWSLTWRRTNWSPAFLDGALTLRETDEGWTGSGWCPTIHGGRFFFTAADVSVQGADVAFVLRVEGASYPFHGTITGATIEGAVEWTDASGGSQRDALVAARRDVRRFDRMPAGPFERADPEATGLDAGELDRLVLLAEESGSDALVVVSDGKLVALRTFGAEPIARDLQSITKAVSSLAIGMLVGDGTIRSVDEPLATWLPEMKDRPGVTLRHVLMHSSGLDPGTTEALNDAPDRLAHALSRPLAGTPGARFEYNNAAAQLVSGVVRAAAHEEIDAFLRRRLFDPLGIASARWAHDRADHAASYAGLSLDPLDLAVLGQALADGGRWKGAQVVPGGWIDRLVTEHGDGGATLGWFRIGDGERADGFWHSGSGGQTLHVFPDARLVVVRLALVRRGEAAIMNGLPALVEHLAASKPRSPVSPPRADGAPTTR